MWPVKGKPETVGPFVGEQASVNLPLRFMAWWLVYVLQIKSIVSPEGAATLISKLLPSDAACYNSLLFICPGQWYTVLHTQRVIDNTHSQNTDIDYSSCGWVEVQHSAGTGVGRKTRKFECNRAHSRKSSWNRFPGRWDKYECWKAKEWKGVEHFFQGCMCLKQIINKLPSGSIERCLCKRVF